MMKATLYILNSFEVKVSLRSSLMGLKSVNVNFSKISIFLKGNYYINFDKGFLKKG